MIASEKNVFRPQKKWEFGIAQRFSFREYPKAHRPASQSVLHFDLEQTANSLRKRIF